jgi:hypothetical protein
MLPTGKIRCEDFPQKRKTDMGRLKKKERK